MPSELVAGTLGALDAGLGSPSTACTGSLKWKLLPRPGSLSTQMLPPISCTSRAQMVRPSPVPPNSRVVELSA